MHEEGRVLQIESDSFLHEFVLRDHLGNVRVVFNDQYPDGLIKEHLGEILQEHHHYPFGLEWGPVYGNPPTAGNSIAWYWQAGDDEHRFRYNGKEFHGHEINWLDYGARWYDPVIGRWGQVDPLAEKYANISLFSYVSNNPVLFVDSDGMKIVNPYEEYSQYAGLEEKLNAAIKSAHSCRLSPASTPVPACGPAGDALPGRSCGP